MKKSKIDKYTKGKKQLRKRNINDGLEVMYNYINNYISRYINSGGL